MMTNTNTTPDLETLATAFARFIEAARLIVGVRVFVIATDKLPAVQHEVAKVARRAAKHGLPCPALVILSEPFTVTRKIGRVLHARECVRVRLDAPTLRVAGASFVAACEHTDGGTLILAAPSAEGRDLSAYRTLDGRRCDHCNTRRARSRSFVVDTADGEKVVGSSCLRDFFGVDVAAEAAWKGFGQLWAMLAAAAAGTGELGDGEGGSASWGRPLTREYLARAVYSVYAEGFRPTRFEPSTVSHVAELMNPSRKAMQEDRAYAEIVHTAGGRAYQAAAAYLMGWALLHLGTSDFDHNLRVMAGSCVLPNKGAGLLCYLPEAYRRARGEETARRAPKAPSAHVGDVGARLDFDVVVKGVNVFDSAYGPRSLVRFEDAAGNVLTWWASGYFEVDPGAKGTIKGTVKAHETYKGTAQTVLTRCKWQG